ncbi:hypothetical protein GE09DRAFT_561806 [Coniochaeta sp. 2T2.1]|nr:hypothetical protein GE09DRAFT_561806 [Coniochaeta sp. 2T2.1]
MMADRKTLADLGHDILALFERACNQQKNGYNTSEQWPATSLISEAERFQLWAVDLGLFDSAHGSLDYRLREACSLQHTISRFLKELADSLTEIIQVESDRTDQPVVAVNEDGEDSEEEELLDEERSDADSEHSSNVRADLSDIDIVRWYTGHYRPVVQGIDQDTEHVFPERMDASSEAQTARPRNRSRLLESYPDIRPRPCQVAFSGISEAQSAPGT